MRRGEIEGRQQVFEVRTLPPRSTERGRALPTVLLACFSCWCCSLLYRCEGCLEAGLFLLSLQPGGQDGRFLGGCVTGGKYSSTALQYSSSESWKGEMRCCLVGN